MRTVALCIVPAVVFAAWVIAFIRTFRVTDDIEEGQ